MRKITTILGLVLLLSIAMSYSSHAQNDLNYLRSLYGEDSVMLFVKRAYTDTMVTPVSESSFDNIRSKTVGESFRDPNFGREWTLMYNGGTKIMNSERNSWNCDSSLISLTVTSYEAYYEFALFNGDDASYIKKVRFNKPYTDITQLRWMPNDPNKMFYFYGDKMYTFDVNTTNVATYETFASFNLSASGIAGGDGNEVAPNGDLLIGNKGPNCFVYNIPDKKVVRIVNGSRTYFDPGQSFTTFDLGIIDYAIAFAGHIIELDEDNGGTVLRDLNGTQIQEFYRRTPHFDPTYFKHNDTLYPGFYVRYNDADADYYNNLGYPSVSGTAYFHGWTTSDPTQFVRFEMDPWPSSTLASGGQHSSNRYGGTSGLILQHGPGEYDLSPWDQRYGECFEFSLYTADATMPRRFAHHYIGYDAGYTTSYQPEGWLSPNGDFAIIKTKWAFYKVALGNRMSKIDVNNYLGTSTVIQYALTLNTSGSGTVSNNPSGSDFDENTNVSLTATPNTGYQFDNWSGDLTGSTNPATLIMNANKSITANFSLIPTQNSDSVYQAEDVTSFVGEIESNHTGYTGTGFVDLTNAVGSHIEFNVNVADAASYNLLVRYASGSTSNRPMEIKVNSSVQFDTVNYQPTGDWIIWVVDTLTIDLNAGANTLRWTSLVAEGGPNFDKIELYQIPTESSDSVYQAEDMIIYHGNVETNHTGYTGTGFVDLTNEIGSYIDWDISVPTQGDYDIIIRYASGSTNNRTMQINVNGSQQLSTVGFMPTGAWDIWDTQTFTVTLDAGANTLRTLSTMSEGGPNIDKLNITQDVATYYTLSSSVVGLGSVLITPSGSSYLSGTQVTITATPNSGNQFDSWSGDETGTTNPLIITMDANKSITADFSTIYHTISTNVVGSGTISLTPAGGTYAEGTSVMVVANPDTDWLFSGWSGDAIDTNDTIIVSVDANKSYTATFNEMWTQLLFNDFETGWENFSGGGNTSLYTGGSYAHNGNNALDIEDDKEDGSSVYLSNAIDISTAGYKQLKIDFWFYAVSMDPGEDWFFQYYDGTQWNVIKTYLVDTDFANEQFYSESIIIDEAGYTFPTNANIKFTCDASGGADDVYIDEVEISATTSSHKSSQVAAISVDNKKQITGIQAYPNPFKNQITLQFELDNSNRVAIDLISIDGRIIRSLPAQSMNIGKQKVDIPINENLNKGLYLLRVSIGNKVETIKINHF